MHISKKNYKILCCFLSMTIICSACGNQTESFHTFSGTVYSNGYATKLPNAYCYLDNRISILDYSSMQVSTLCNKPNCDHKGIDCIMVQLNDETPLICGDVAYYFVDDYPQMVSNEEGKVDLKLGTTLYQYDFAKGSQKEITYIDGVSASAIYGWLLVDDTIYFSANLYGREYDENGILCSYASSGGKFELYAVSLKTNEVTNYGEIYNNAALCELYPGVINSGEVYLEGIFNNRIYFNVAFVEDTSKLNCHYVQYTKSFDLESKTFSAEPEDLSQISYESVAYISEDDMAVVTDKSSIKIYENSSDDPIVIEDSDIYLDIIVSVINGKLFLPGKFYELETGNCVEMSLPTEDSQVIAYIEGQYIVSYYDERGTMQFEKISEQELVGSGSTT